MPRKFFRKYLPTHAAISENRYMIRFGSWFRHHNLWHLHRRSVAGGVAVGMFAGLVPGSNPVQFAVSALLAVAFRVNLPIAIVVTLYTNPFTIVPLYYVAFKLGQLVLGDSSSEMPSMTFDVDGNDFAGWLAAAADWLSSIGKPLLVGLPLLALLLSAVGYAVTRLAWRWYVVSEWQRRKLRMKGST